VTYLHEVEQLERLVEGAAAAARMHGGVEDTYAGPLRSLQLELRQQLLQLAAAAQLHHTRQQHGLRHGAARLDVLHARRVPLHMRVLARALLGALAAQHTRDRRLRPDLPLCGYGVHPWDVAGVKMRLVTPQRLLGDSSCFSVTSCERKIFKPSTGVGSHLCAPGT
jgi:hypothetical protein